MTDSQPILEVKNISKYYDIKNGGELLAVQDISLSLHPREFICVLGPTSSGKSTLLKMMGGVEKPTLGSILLGGVEYDDGVPASELKRFGYVFQQDNLLPWRVVSKNLALPLEVFKIKSDNARRIADMLQLVGLQDYARVYPHELSGGMRQRVSLARAMVHDPDILLMDQPLGALDAITRKMLSYELLRISRAAQKAVVMVTNSIDEALLLSDRIVVFTSLPGRIAEEVVNDIPLDARDETIMENARYKDLRARLDRLVHAQNQAAAGDHA